MSVSPKSLADLLAPRAVAVEEALENWLIEPGTPAALAEAMRYCVLCGGKRLRPALVWLSAEAVGISDNDELVSRAAVAVELVHSYSLVHDDLPPMDDDAVRRGLPTAHVQYGEAMAILVGDALLTRAFGVLAETEDPRAPRLVAELTVGAGPAGMVAGQVADMDLCDLPDGIDGMQFVHQHKTADLMRTAARMGAIAAGANGELLAALTEYGQRLGLAFQAADDLLDAVGDEGTLGKATGKDVRCGKRSVVAHLGVDGSRQRVQDLSQQAAAALEPLGKSAATLHQLAAVLADRTY
ncbi:MAG: polyprenyl synthetase family protein [Planctomycetota bacterium]